MKNPSKSISFKREKEDGLDLGGLKTEIQKIKDSPSLFQDHKTMLDNRKKRKEVNKKLKKVRMKYQDDGESLDDPFCGRTRYHTLSKGLSFIIS